MTRRILILGAGGFIGRHASMALHALGSDVDLVLAGRHPDRMTGRLPPELHALPRVGIQLHELTSNDAWRSHLHNVDVVLNCVGILRERGAETYDLVHHQSPGALAQACAEQNIRLVHVSALGLTDNAKSGFLTSKQAGERAIRQAGGDWILARPSLLDGPGGYGAKWLRGVAKLPFFVAPTDAKGKIGALNVDELGEALARLCAGSTEQLNLAENRTFELGGPDLFAFADYIRHLRKAYTDAPAICLPVPSLLARLGAHLCDLVHATPFSFGHWELLRNDNFPAPNRMAELLGREPSPIRVQHHS